MAGLRCDPHGIHITYHLVVIRMHSLCSQDAADLLDINHSRAARLPVVTPTGAACATTCHSTLSLFRSTRNLVGREREVQAVSQSLRQHGVAVIWGSPGEGKTAVAAEAGCRLLEDASAGIRVSAVLDLRGACGLVLWTYSQPQLRNCAGSLGYVPRRPTTAAGTGFDGKLSSVVQACRTW